MTTKELKTIYECKDDELNESAKYDRQHNPKHTRMGVYAFITSVVQNRVQMRQRELKIEESLNPMDAIKWAFDGMGVKTEPHHWEWSVLSVRLAQRVKAQESAKADITPSFGRSFSVEELGLIAKIKQFLETESATEEKAFNLLKLAQYGDKEAKIFLSEATKTEASEMKNPFI